MFTGIIESLGTLRQIEPIADGARLVIDTGSIAAAELQQGESLAVNGCCLTVTATDPETNCASFDLLQQTLELTNLGDTGQGDTLNLERAMAANGRLSGHLVQGHVDATATLADIQASGQDHRILVTIPPHLLPQIIDKGSICLDGTSLTVADIDDAKHEITLHIIPHTWHHTRLHTLKPGARLNLETDVLGKYVQRYLANMPPLPPSNHEKQD